MTETLLVELLTEELPPKALSRLGEAFAAGITQALQSRALLDEGAVSTAYATPRRLAVSITKVRSNSPDKEVREKVLPVTVALDAEGRATAPLSKKLAALATSTGAGEIKLEQLERAPDGKAESLFYRYTARGIDLAQGLQQALEDTMGKLPIPKVMSYQRPDGSTVQFVRPVHKLIALLGEKVLPLSTLGLAAGQTTLGHRFLSEGEIRIAAASDYAGALEQQGRVVASFAERRERIRAELLKAAGEDKILMPEALLDEVTALVEWPVVYACHFDDAFLAVPQECLILTMQTNQKYFALTDASGKLRSRFLIVSNIQAQDARHIITGNERVVRPRLSDAKFFFEQDQKKTLESRLPGLASVVYHNKLGTQEARTQRVKALATAVAEQLGWDKDLAGRAALLAKTDLLTDMVGEFPELQGIMGTYYARHDGEADEVARAISEHYQPRFAGDALPQTHAGTVVALADKLETLVGIWGIGLAPTGDKDPFALRRHALGVLRMLVEKRLPLSIAVLLESAASLFAGNANFKDPSVDLQAFLMDRLRGLLRERGYAQGQVEAVVAQNPDRLDNVIERLDAVQAFAALPEAESLAAANKRISNILKKTSPAGGAVKTELLSAGAERGLHDALVRLLPQTEEAWARGDFAGTLKSLAQVRNDVDAFFNDVMVMAEDEALRNNRLALLASLHEVMNRVADISKLAA